jgi:hypothetical protein
MSKKTLGLVMFVLGAIIAVISLTAHAIGLGKYEGNHWAQQLGLAIGIVAVIAGVWFLLSKVTQKKKVFWTRLQAKE